MIERLTPITGVILFRVPTFRSLEVAMQGSLGKVGIVIAGLGAAVVSSVAVDGTAEAAGRHAVAAADTVTGCLAKGDEKGEYTITTKDGKKYGLRSSKVALSKHVGHTVTVVGTPYKEGGEDEKAEKGEDKASEEAADLRVTSLKMLSPSCQ